MDVRKETVVIRKEKTPSEKKFKCEVDGCPSNAANSSVDVQFMSYPTDLRLPFWIAKTKGPGSSWTPRPDSRVCTLHFPSHNFCLNRKFKTLVKGAMPSLNLRNQHRSTSDVTLPTSIMPSQPSLPLSSSPSSDSYTCPPTKRQKINDAPELSVAPLKVAKTSSPGNGELSKNKSVRQNSIKRPTITKNIPPSSEFGDEQEDDYLNKILLKRNLNGLIIEVEELSKETNDPKEIVQLKSLSFILHKARKNLALSVGDALIMFQKEISSKVYDDVKRLFQTSTGKHTNALVRTFSLSIHFFCPSAYEFMRKQLSYSVPHSRTITSWYAAIDRYM